MWTTNSLKYFIALSSLSSFGRSMDISEKKTSEVKSAFSVKNRAFIISECLLIKLPTFRLSRPRQKAFRFCSRFTITSSWIRYWRKLSLLAGTMVSVIHHPLLLRINSLDGLSRTSSI